MGKSRAPKKQKVEIVFNPEKRKEFLTGFRKRKNERRKKAKLQLENTLKEERKRIRQEIKDGLSKLKKTYEPLKELTEEDKREEQYEDDDVTVKIVELSTSDLAAQNNLIGENRGAASESEEEPDEDDDDEDGDDDENQNSLQTIPGMDLVEKKSKKIKPVKDSDSVEPKSNQFTSKELKNKKDIDRLKKNKTFNKLKKSKAFKMKELLDKKANQKKFRRDRNNTLKSLPKSGIRKLRKAHQTKFNKGRMMSRKQRRAKNN